MEAQDDVLGLKEQPDQGQGVLVASASYTPGPGAPQVGKVVSLHVVWCPGQEAATGCPRGVPS